MANVYSRVLTPNLRPNFSAAPNVRNNAERELFNCAGGRTMLKANRNNWTPNNNMAQIVNELHQQLIIWSNWVWDPSVAGSDGRSVLDGTRTSGECQFLAAALKGLLVALPPFGFGVNPALLNVVTYNGESGDGFIARHDVRPGGWFGLTPNVYHQNGMVFRNLYMWADHKVLQYGGRYWDVCYNTSYNNLVDMACVRLGALTSRFANGAITGEYPGLSATPNLTGEYRLTTPGTPAFTAQARLIGPY